LKEKFYGTSSNLSGAPGFHYKSSVREARTCGLSLPLAGRQAFLSLARLRKHKQPLLLPPPYFYFFNFAFYQ
jgi:hypothetical protein